MLCLSITVGLMLFCSATSADRRGKAHIELWKEIQDLEAEEDSSLRFQDAISIKGTRHHRSRRSAQLEDLEAQEDSSAKFKTLSESDNARTKRNPNPQSWRTPRNYQFVTRTIRQDREPVARSGRLIESGGRFYDDRSSYPEYRRRDVQEVSRRSNFPNKRVIYYATLPEPTRRPEYDRYLREFERDYRDREYERQYNYDKYYNSPNPSTYSNPNPNTYSDYPNPNTYQEHDRDRYDNYNNKYDQNFNSHKYEADNNRQYSSDRPYSSDGPYNADRQYNADYTRPYNPDYNRHYNKDYNSPSYPGYPSIKDNEITRVSSSIIDVTSKDERKEREKEDPGLSKFVIIDREPPYLKDVYNFLSSFKPNNDEKYNEFLSQYTKEEVPLERNTKKPPRKQTSVPLPPLELTVFKGKPLDIRPLDINVETSTNKDRPTSTHKPTTLNPIQEFERNNYKY